MPRFTAYYATHYAEIFLLFFRLGLSSFGGPAAHFLRFEQCFVRDHAWLSLEQYRQLVALCQFLPGPASSQVGMGIGLQRAGLVGALLAFIGFTLPSFVLMCAAAVAGLHWLSPQALQGAFCGLAAVVAHAIWQMAHSLTPDWPRRWLALVALPGFWFFPEPQAQFLLLLLFALLGAAWLRPRAGQSIPTLSNPEIPTRRRLSIALLVLFFLLFFGLPLLLLGSDLPLLSLAEACYRAGALVFGGGHVVLPLLQQHSGMVLAESDFLAGYAAAQLLPGPLFSFAAYLGIAAGQGVVGALVATLALFLPGALLVCAILPWWHRLGRNQHLQGAVAAVNSAVLALLLVSWCTLILPHAVTLSWHWGPLLLGMLLLWRRWCPAVLLIPLWSVLYGCMSLN